MADVSHNTTFFPVSPPQLATHTLRRATEALAALSTDRISTEEKLKRAREAIETLAETIVKQEVYNQTLKRGLDDAFRAVHSRINARPAVGLLADRPPPSGNILYVSTDETPPVLYAAVNGVWVAFTSDT
jgi:hypothetical protein